MNRRAWVARVGGWGYTVRPISFKEATHVYKVREALEVQAVREALPRSKQLRLRTYELASKQQSRSYDRSGERNFVKTRTAFTMLLTIEDRTHLLGAMMATYYRDLVDM